MKGKTQVLWQASLGLLLTLLGVYGGARCIGDMRYAEGVVAASIFVALLLTALVLRFRVASLFVAGVLVVGYFVAVNMIFSAKAYWQLAGTLGHVFSYSALPVMLAGGAYVGCRIAGLVKSAHTNQH